MNVRPTFWQSVLEAFNNKPVRLEFINGKVLTGEITKLSADSGIMRTLAPERRQITFSYADLREAAEA